MKIINFKGELYLLTAIIMKYIYDYSIYYVKI